MNDQLLPKRYVEVEVDGKRLLLGDIRESKGLLIGFRVHKDGSRFWTETKTTDTSYLVVTKPEAVRAELRLNKFYGELERI